MFILKNFSFGHPNKCIYQFIGDDTKKKTNILLFVFYIGTFIEVKSYVALILYGQNMINNTAIYFI